MTSYACRQTPLQPLDRPLAPQVYFPLQHTPKHTASNMRIMSTLYDCLTLQYPSFLGQPASQFSDGTSGVGRTWGMHRTLCIPLVTIAHCTLPRYRRRRDTREASRNYCLVVNAG